MQNPPDASVASQDSKGAKGADTLSLWLRNISGEITVDGVRLAENLAERPLKEDEIVGAGPNGYCTINLGQTDKIIVAQVASGLVRAESEQAREAFQPARITMVKATFPPTVALNKYTCRGETFYELSTEAGTIRVRE
jgi:hypothetical protein